jgi:hypothetical protein
VHPVGDSHRGPLIMGKSHLSKIIKANDRTHKLQITPRTAAAQGKERPMAQKASAAQQTVSLSAPRANLCLARGAGAAPRNPRLARGLCTPSGESPSRSRDPAPRVNYASLEATSDPRHHTYSPDRGIECSDASRAPGSKVNPYHAGPLTPPGNQIPALFDQPALCGHPRRCAGAVRDGQCHSATLCHPLPYRLHVALLERGQRHP